MDICDNKRKRGEVWGCGILGLGSCFFYEVGSSGRLGGVKNGGLEGAKVKRYGGGSGGCLRKGFSVGDTVRGSFRAEK